jgi:hypothetical protein
VLVGRGLRLGVGEERVVLRHPVIGPGAQVGHHDVAGHARRLRGVHRADGGIAVDGVGALGVPATRAGRPDHRVLTVQERGQPVGVELLDVGDQRERPRGRDLVLVLRVADHARDDVAPLDEQRGEPERDLAVTADDQNTGHGASFREVPFRLCRVPDVGASAAWRPDH